VGKQFINELKVGDAVQSDFAVVEKALNAFSQPNRAGEYFLRLQLADVTGTLRAVAWEQGPELAALFEVGDVVRIRGEISNYHGPQLIIYSLEPVAPAEINYEYFQKVAPRSRAEMLDELHEMINKVSHPYLQSLLQAFFADEAFLQRYSQAPAARTVHHNYVGGLLEHALETAALCEYFVQLHPTLDLSLLICGALLHDVGKLEEYEVKGMSIQLTTAGKLLGHIMIGKEMLDAKIRQIPDFPADLHMQLAHLMLAHHGQKEWGSPEIPRTFEAYALHHADLISARLNQFAQAAQKSGHNSKWTEYDRLLARDIYLGKAE
jgi:3'-5' exoribonuclease